MSTDRQKGRIMATEVPSIEISFEAVGLDEIEARLERMVERGEYLQGVLEKALEALSIIMPMKDEKADGA